MSEDITRADLEYMFNTAAEKFFKTFNAAKVEPTITIQNATISGEADVKKINEELSKMVQKSTDVAAVGRYSESPSHATMVKQIKKSEIIKEIHDAVIESLSSGITIDLDVRSASCKIRYPAGAAEKAAENVIWQYIGNAQVID